MKTEMIDRLVAPYVKNQQLTYDDFDKIFGSALTHKEEYKIVDYLDSKGIELVDELPENADNDSLDGMDSILELDDQQDDEPDSASDDSKEEELVVYNKNVRQKNSTLCMMIQQGNKQAVQDLCVKNQKLVIKYAYEYSKRTKFLTIDDLAQFGYFGLMRAAQGYDPAKGTSSALTLSYGSSRQSEGPLRMKKPLCACPFICVKQSIKLRNMTISSHAKGLKTCPRESV